MYHLNVNNHVIVVIALSLPCIALGYVAGYTTAATETLLVDFKITMHEISWFGSLSPLFATFGSFFVGIFGYNRGRKRLIILCYFLQMIGLFIVPVSPNKWMLYFGRIISGLCMGIFCTILPVYVAEIVPPKTRGGLSLLLMSSFKLGTFVCFALGMSLKWKALGWCGFALSVPFGFFIYLIPESPIWYVNHEENETALKVLRWLNNKNESVDEEFKKLIKYRQELLAQPPFVFTVEVMKKYYKPVLIVVVLMFFQDWSGFYAAIYYATVIFNMAHSSIEPHLCTFILGLVNLIASIIGAILIDHLGRRILLSVSFILMFVCLVILGIHFYLMHIKVQIGSVGWVPLFTLIVLIAAHSAGAGPIPWLLMGEMLPTKVRTSGSAVIGALSYFFIFGAVKTFVNLENAMEDYGALWLYATFSLVAFAFTLLFVPETKKVPLQDIERTYVSPTTTNNND